jgi:hypothetical protein
MRVFVANEGSDSKKPMLSRCNSVSEDHHLESCYACYTYPTNRIKQASSIMSKKPTKAPGFFAVRRGAGYLRNAIFLNWEDCHVHVFRGVQGAEYAVFETVEAAINYLSEPTISPNEAGQQLAATKRKAPPPPVPKAAPAPAAPNTSNKRPRVAQPTEEKSKSPIKAKKPSNSWETMFSRLREKLEGKNDHAIDTGTDLDRWITDQRRGYRNMKEEKKTLLGMTAEKAKRLKEIGFDFRYATWADYFQQLQEVRKENDVDNLEEVMGEQNPELLKWYAKQKIQYRAFSKGKQCKLDAPQIHQLQTIGFGADSKKSDDEFTEMFQELREYKRKNGHCNIHTQSKENINLSKWVIKQRVHYKQLKDGKSSQMTAERMIKLTDLGFVFVPKGKNPSWEERIAECRKFHAEHGNIRFPKADQAMRSWVSRVRSDYRLFKEGKTCNLTREKIEILNEMSMIWDTGFASGPMRFPRKTWDERFEDTLDFIRLHGHSVVPQATPGLGEWVHTQRVEYKKLQLGKKSAMTAERALKLVTIGFVFDAQKKRGAKTECYDDSYA